MQSNSGIWQSPSFETYSSSNKLAKIAARVINEFQPHPDLDHHLLESQHLHLVTHQNTIIPHKQHGEDGLKKLHDSIEEEEFEFTSTSREDKLLPRDQIKPTYPIFNNALLFDNYDNVHFDMNSPSLRKHFNEEECDHDLQSSSSDDADELDRVPPEMYCIWKPKKADMPSESSEKSNSTSWSKSWTFRDIFLRSNSEGKQSFVFLTSFKGKKDTTKIKKEAVKDVNAVASKVVMAVDYSVLNGKMKESDGRRTYVPYMKDIVGMFANANNVSRNLLPF